jgi:hypothetical protein
MNQPQPALFNPAETVPPRCYSCGNTKKNLCRFDADVDKNLIPASSTRPASCLNRHDPAAGVIPY